ncbi:MAG: hypothetical protein R2941_07480 [Desulfobacterales bacterium]
MRCLHQPGFGSHGLSLFPFILRFSFEILTAKGHKKTDPAPHKIGEPAFLPSATWFQQRIGITEAADEKEKQGTSLTVFASD